MKAQILTGSKTVKVGDVDCSRESIYTRMEGE
jgi:hypothetical protein